MRETRHLRLHDLRSAYRLIGECVEIGQDAQSWRRRMLQELCRLTGAAVGVGGEIVAFGSSRQQTVEVVDVGWTGSARRVWLKYQQTGKQHDPLYRRMTRALSDLRRQPRRTCITRSREQLLPDDGWYGSDYFEQYQRPAQVDSRLVSVYGLGGKAQSVNVIALQRGLGEPRFSPRDRRLLHLFHCELGRLIGRRVGLLPTVSFRANRRGGDESDPTLVVLPPRLRQTLFCLVQGGSEKQVALRLGLSPHTVHGYVKQLHAHFKVQSRGELLARTRDLEIGDRRWEIGDSGWR